MERNEVTVQEINQRMTVLERKQESVEEKLEKERKRAKKERVEEAREKESRKRNVVIYRVEEAGEWAKTGEEKKEWDLKSCENILKALNLTMNRTSIKFCRRLGEKGEEYQAPGP